MTSKTCSYRDCGRAARKGWTTCSRHYTAGRAAAQARPAEAECSCPDKYGIGLRDRDCPSHGHTAV